MKIGLFTMLLSLSISVFTVLCSTDTLHAKTEVLFSPGGSINDTIRKNIVSSSSTIDVAAFTFTAGDIAEALYQAKERGVVVRVIVDQTQDAKNYPVLEFLKEEGFNLQFLKGNIGGSMNNAFAIFDDKLLVTGSYTLTEYAEKFNYENAIFIDEPDVVDKYKKEFELLYNKGVVQGAKRAEKLASGRDSGMKVVSVSHKTDESAKHGNAGSINEKANKGTITEGRVGKFTAGKDDEGFRVIESNKQIQTIENPLKQFVDISFNEIDKLFGSESKLNKSEKISLWKSKFEGKYVSWTGRVGFRGFAVYNWNKIGISHKGSNIDVNLKFDYSKQRTVMTLNVGDIITYTGRLVSLSSMLSSYRLEDADVVQVVR
ncbi:MAG: DUF1669 domain-containing protein [Candidatus Brocadiales bacterium]|nr:DUF1669 domain-containing protein [Candidatus Brocadiales bacterium]